MKKRGSSSGFMPTMLGYTVLFSDYQGNLTGKGMITDENETEIYIEATINGEACADWMSKTEYGALLGVAD